MSCSVAAARVSLGNRIRQLAEDDPDRVALTFLPAKGGARALSRRELDDAATQLAGRLIARGVTVGQRVAIALENSPEHVVAALAVWKAGGSVVTLRWDTPEWERERLVAATRPALILADSDGTTVGGTPVVSVHDRDQAVVPVVPPPDLVPEYAVAVPSGGSTGASKAIVMPFPGALVPGETSARNQALLGTEPITSQIVFAPLYHGNPFQMVHQSLFDELALVLMEKFDAAQLVQAIATYRPHFMTLAPTMMKRLLDLPEIGAVDWACFRAILHGTAACPPWLKHRFIDLVGAERLWEVFASTEQNGVLLVRGDDWLAHPGTVGRPAPGTELKILDEAQAEVPAGELGEIYMRLAGTTGPAYRYLGADRPKIAAGGFTSVGDLGHVDEDGWVFSSDRRTDLIITGGANVVPAEVEAALSEHPDVADVAVIGLPDVEWGKRVHALVVPVDPHAPPTTESLKSHARARLAAYKVPKTYELLEALPRSEAFKLRRSELVLERTEQA